MGTSLSMTGTGGDDRVHDGGGGRWSPAAARRLLGEVDRAGGCVHPVRPVGATVDGVTGELREGTVGIACKNGRAAVCPACAARYRGDAWHLLAAGLRGGKGVPETVATHPPSSCIERYRWVVLGLRSSHPLRRQPAMASLMVVDGAPGPHLRGGDDRRRRCLLRHQPGELALGRPLGAPEQRALVPHPPGGVTAEEDPAVGTEPIGRL